MHSLRRDGMEFGSFFIGGRDVQVAGRETRSAHQTGTVSFEQDPNGTYRVEQAYVQWFRPPGGGPKVVLQHGGGLCGTIWEATPDGRTGWAQFFLARGFEVYVVDNVERGRAGWCPFEEIWPQPAISRTAEETWSLFRIGRADDFRERRPFPRQRFPVEHFDAFLSFVVPRWPRSTELPVARLAELVRRIGACSLIGHSQGGEIVLRAAAQASEHVEDIVLVEPSGSVPGRFGTEFRKIRHLFLMGDFLDQHPVFRQLDGAVQDWVAELNELGSTADLVRVDGNSHMMMMDYNSDAVAAIVADWLQDRVAAASAAADLA